MWENAATSLWHDVYFLSLNLGVMKPCNIQRSPIKNQTDSPVDVSPISRQWLAWLSSLCSLWLCCIPVPQSQSEAASETCRWSQLNPHKKGELRTALGRQAQLVLHNNNNISKWTVPLFCCSYTLKQNQKWKEHQELSVFTMSLGVIDLRKNILCQFWLVYLS